MKSYWNHLDKMLIAETKIELLSKFIDDLESLPKEIGPKFQRKLVNYKRNLRVEQEILGSIVKSIHEKYPPKGEPK